MRYTHINNNMYTRAHAQRIHDRSLCESATMCVNRLANVGNWLPQIGYHSQPLASNQAKLVRITCDLTRVMSHSLSFFFFFRQ